VTGPSDSTDYEEVSAVEEKKRLLYRPAAVALAALVAVTTLASGCGGSSSSTSEPDRQAFVALAKDVQLCVQNRTGSVMEVVFSWMESNGDESTRSAVTDGVGTPACYSRYQGLTARFTTPGGIPVTFFGYNGFNTRMDVVFDGQWLSFKDENLPEGFGSKAVLSSGDVLWYQRLSDTDDFKRFNAIVS
jgi:hypothetical protein